MSFIEESWQFIYKYYINGIVNDTSYNIVDTLTYAIILIISLFGVFKLLKKLNIVIDKYFILSVLPYIFAGSSLRVLEDSKFFQPPIEYIFITPVIYIFMFFSVTLILLFSKFLEKKSIIKDYHILFAIIGIIWFFLNLSILLIIDNITNPILALYILILGTTFTSIIYLISQKLNFTVLTDKLNISILFAHLLDASSTVIGIEFLNYHEEHVVPTFFISLLDNYIPYPSLIMYILKLVVFIPAIYILDTDYKEQNFINLIKLVILVLGLSPATRNTLRILMGV